MKNALEWIGNQGRRGKTWSDVSSLNGISGLLFAYPSETRENVPELSGLIVGFDTDDDPDGASFEACAKRVVEALRGTAATVSGERPYLRPRQAGWIPNEGIARRSLLP